MTGFDSCSWSCFRSERRRGGEKISRSYEPSGREAAANMDVCMQARS